MMNNTAPASVIGHMARPSNWSPIVFVVAAVAESRWPSSPHATVNELLTIWVRDWQREKPAPREELMDTPTSAAPDEKTPSLDLALAKEKSKLSGQLEIGADRFNSSVARLTSNSIGELQGLVSELQKMQEFLTSEVDSVQRQIDSALGGINIIVETIGPWKGIASRQTLPPGTRNVRAGGLAAHIEQRNRVG
jgi:hypothetical protein